MARVKPVNFPESHYQKKVLNRSKEPQEVKKKQNYKNNSPLNSYTEWIKHVRYYEFQCLEACFRTDVDGKAIREQYNKLYEKKLKRPADYIPLRQRRRQVQQTNKKSNRTASSLLPLFLDHCC